MVLALPAQSDRRMEPELELELEPGPGPQPQPQPQPQLQLQLEPAADLWAERWPALQALLAVGSAQPWDTDLAAIPAAEGGRKLRHLCVLAADRPQQCRLLLAGELGVARLGRREQVMNLLRRVGAELLPPVELALARLEESSDSDESYSKDSEEAGRQDVAGGGSRGAGPGGNTYIGAVHRARPLPHHQAAVLLGGAWRLLRRPLWLLLAHPTGLHVAVRADKPGVIWWQPARTRPRAGVALAHQPHEVQPGYEVKLADGAAKEVAPPSPAPPSPAQPGRPE